MTLRAVVAIPLLLLLPHGAHAQEAPAGVTLAAYSVVPEAPGFAEPFEVELLLRIPSGSMVLLGPELGESAGMEGMGPGRLEIADGPGDSTEVRATYPAIAYQSGLQELPVLPIRVSNDAGQPGDSTVSIGASGASANDSSWTMLRIGAALIGEFMPLEDSAAVAVPRPPADVLGGEWSIWLLLAVGFASAAGVGGVGMMVPRWWSATGGRLIATLRRRSPRHDALKELERIRSLGWHRNGRADDFYAALTRAWRHYAERLDPTLGTGLTSTEMLSRLEGSLGHARLKNLTGLVSTAERAKFGGVSPTPEEAERDWAAVRDWVRTGPAS